MRSGTLRGGCGGHPSPALDVTTMTAQSQTIDWNAVEEAFEALQPFYGPGDDGDGIRLALDAIASVLSDATKHELEGDEQLATLLEELKAADELVAMVEAL